MTKKKLDAALKSIRNINDYGLPATVADIDQLLEEKLIVKVPDTDRYGSGYVVTGHSLLESILSECAGEISKLYKERSELEARLIEVQTKMNDLFDFSGLQSVTLPKR